MKSQTYEKHFPKLSAEQLAQNATKKVICGMSGGVDSSVSAFILQQQGYQVEGLFMKNWEEDDDTDARIVQAHDCIHALHERGVRVGVHVDICADAVFAVYI